MSSVEKSRSPVETIQGAWRTLAQGSQVAAETLVYLSQYAESEPVRASASMAILDRVGISAKVEMTHRVIPPEYDERGTLDGGMSPGEVIRKRLAELAKSSAEEVARREQEESEIVLAELVED